MTRVVNSSTGHVQDESTTGMKITSAVNKSCTAYVNNITFHPNPRTNKPPLSHVAEYQLRNQTTKGFLFRASHMLSDVICFVATNLDNAADQVVGWLKKCGGVKREDQPAACILLTKREKESSEIPTVIEFVTICSRKIHAQALSTRTEDPVASTFSGLQTFYIQPPYQELPVGVFEQIALSQKRRLANRRLWTRRTFCQLARTLIPRMAQYPSKPLRYAQALDMYRLPRSFTSVEP